jgi:hypothetical protein
MFETICEPTRVSRDDDHDESHVAHIQDPQRPPMIAFCGYRGTRRGEPGEGAIKGYCIVCAEMYGKPLRYRTGWSYVPHYGEANGGPSSGSAPISDERVLELLSDFFKWRT